MNKELYINLSTILFGFYWVCCFSNIVSNGFQTNTNDVKWWNVLILVSFIFSIFYCFYLHHFKSTSYLYRSRKSLYYSITTSILLLISSTIGYKEIKEDINSFLFSTIFFSSCGSFGIILLINIIFNLRNLNYNRFIDDSILIAV